MPRLTQLDRFWQIHRIGRTNRNPIPQRTEAKPDDPGKGRGVCGSGNAVATVIAEVQAAMCTCTHEGLKNGKTYLFVRTKGFRTARFS